MTGGSSPRRNMSQYGESLKEPQSLSPFHLEKSTELASEMLELSVNWGEEKSLQSSKGNEI